MLNAVVVGRELRHEVNRLVTLPTLSNRHRCGVILMERDMSYQEDVQIAISRFQTSAKAKADHIVLYKHMAAAAEAWGVQNGAAAALASLGTDPNNAKLRFAFSGTDPVGSITTTITANNTLLADTSVQGNQTAKNLVTATGNALSSALTAATAGHWLDSQKFMGQAQVAAAAADANATIQADTTNAKPHSATVVSDVATAVAAVGFA